MVVFDVIEVEEAIDKLAQTVVGYEIVVVIRTGPVVVDEGVYKLLLNEAFVVVISVLVDRVGTITELHGGNGVSRISEGAVALAVAVYVYTPSIVT